MFAQFECECKGRSHLRSLNVSVKKVVFAQFESECKGRLCLRSLKVSVKEGCVCAV